MAIMDRRILGYTNQFPAAPSGSVGGDGNATDIQNNVSGYMLKATGDPTTIAGVEDVIYDGSTLLVAGDMYVKSSKKFYLDGTDSAGGSKKYRIGIVGGILKVEEQ